MPFNPDEYLAKTESSTPSKGFDPDAYLSKETKPTVDTKPKTSTAEALAMGFAKGSNFGFQDEIEGAIGAAKRGAEYLTSDKNKDKNLLDAIKTGYKTDRDASRYYQKMLENEHPIADTVGSLASAVPSLGAKGAVTISSMIGQGALNGLGNSEGDAIDQLKSTATGGALGAGLYGAGKVVGSAANKAGDILNDIKTNEALKSLGAQKSQMKAIDPAFRDSIAQYAIDKGLINPLKSTSDKIAATDVLKNQIGEDLNATRSKLPSFSLDEVKSAVANKLPDFNPNLEINKPLASQLNVIENDLNSLAAQGKISAKDLLDYKASLYQMARKSSGEVNPSKDLLESARQGMGKLEESIANSPQYSQNLKDYAKVKTIDKLLENKSAQEANSVLGIGGLTGGVTGGVTGGAPGAFLGSLLGTPTARTKIAETAVLGINAAQKSKILQAVQKGLIDPKIAAYLLRSGVQN